MNYKYDKEAQAEWVGPEHYHKVSRNPLRDAIGVVVIGGWCGFIIASFLGLL